MYRHPAQTAQWPARELRKARVRSYNTSGPCLSTVIASPTFPRGTTECIICNRWFCLKFFPSSRRDPYFWSQKGAGTSGHGILDPTKPESKVSIQLSMTSGGRFIELYFSSLTFSLWAYKGPYHRDLYEGKVCFVGVFGLPTPNKCLLSSTDYGLWQLFL